MHSKIWRFASLLTMLALLASPFFLGSSSFASPSDQEVAPQQPGMRLVQASFVGRSQELRTLAPKAVDPDAPSVLKILQERLVIPKTRQETSGGSDTSIVQTETVGGAMPEPIANFEGVNNLNFVLPPDTQGDIGYDPLTGKKFYVQWVNLSFQIWDVSDPAAPISLYGPAAGNTLWSGTGTICDMNNDGDPITLFDPLAKRWMMSQFALGFPDNFHQCIAVSATADPTGAWYLYDFLTSTSMMNDYPKFGVWPDGYYMTVNQFDGRNYSWGGAGVAVFDRDAMLQGKPAQMIYLDLGQVTEDYGGMLPSDLDGAAPPAGTPNYFMEWDDSSWLGDPNDTLRIWEFRTDWANPLNSTFGLNTSYDPNYMVTTSNQDPDMCNFNASCIPQPVTTVGLDAIADRLMYRLQFRDFGDYQVLLTNHTVDVNGSDWAGVHWFELRDNGNGWKLFQEGVYAPDSDNRWMGSIAMDDSGNIGLGYSVSSEQTYPSIRYTGRLSADPTGLMPQGEASLIEGSGYQTHSASRWGDYSMMAVDPLDGCTFWYTQEYMAVPTASAWQTRIGSFRFPSCTSLPTGFLTGTVSDGSTTLEGASVTAGGVYATVTNANGEYTLEIPEGVYDVTAGMYGYDDLTVSGVEITAGATTVQDFVLQPGQTYKVSGVVKDADTGWPLYARLDIFGYPYGPVFTDPVTGAYSIDMVAGAYDFTVKVMSGGYSQETASVTVSADMTLDFAPQVDLLTCSAPGYVLREPTFSENFDSWPLSGWTVVNNKTGRPVVWGSSEDFSGENYTGGAGTAAEANSDLYAEYAYDTELITPPIQSASLMKYNLVYKANFQIYLGDESLDLDISTNGGASWQNILHWEESHGAWYRAVGETVAVDLEPYIADTFQLRWRYYNSKPKAWDYYAQIDDVSIDSDCTPLEDGFLVVGSVYDANTGAAIDGAVVADGSQKQALWLENVLDPAQPDPLYITGVSPLDAQLTASAYRYQPASVTVIPPASGTVRQDFHLDAGLLDATPDSLEFLTSIIYTMDTQPLNLQNTGGAAAGYEVFFLPGVWVEPQPLGPFAPNTRHIGPKNLMDRDASKLRIDTTPLGVTALDGAGDLLNSWDTGLAATWGIGYNLDVGDLWLGNIGYEGGDDLDYRFETSGSATGDTIDTAAWISLWAADMTYNPFTHTLWQVNVGGDNCVYEMDPMTKAATGGKICPAFGSSQRGLAFDPLTNTYYSGSWNDGILNHFAPDGTMLDSTALGLSTSGLAFNPASGHLFVLTNRMIDVDTYDVYVLDTHDAYNILGGFDLLDGAANVFADYDQGGLELDCDGNLWAVDQTMNKVYVAESGESGVCDWAAEWLSAAPSPGSVPAAGSTQLAVSADMSAGASGSSQAYLRIVSNSPYPDLIVPVTLNIVDKFLYLPLIAK